MSQPRRVPHCSHWGAYDVLVENDEIVGVEPSPLDPAPSPILRSVAAWLDPARRVKTPRVREGWLAARGKGGAGEGRGRDRFVEVSWDQALALVAEEQARVREAHGPASIFAGSYGWTSCGRFHHAQTLVKRWLNLAGGFTGHVDTYSYGAGPVILRHVLGETDALTGRGVTLDAVARHAGTVLIVGALSPRTAQIEAGGLARRTLPRNLEALRESGARIVHVSPLRDDVPAELGAEWWAIRPGTDAALLLGLAGEIVAAGLEDADFLDRCCSGSDQLLAHLRGEDDGRPKTAEWAAEITGLDAEAIRGLARRFAQTRSFVTASWSLQRARFGEQPYWAAIALAAVAGQIGLPGGGVSFGLGSTAGNGGPFGTGRAPSMTAGRNAIDSFIPVARIADLLGNPGAPFTYQGETRAYPDIRMICWAGGNPFHHHQDLNRLARVWARPETIVVQDPMFTATARRADIVLPASTSLERNDIAATSRSDTMIAMHRAVTPRWQARADFEIFQELAERTGVRAGFDEGLDEMGWLRRLYEDARAATRAATGAEGVGFDEFWARGWTENPAREDHAYLAGFRADPEAAPLRTESGRIVLGSRKLAALGHDDCPAHPAWLEPEEWLGAPEAEGRFHLLTQQPQGRLHSQLDTGAASVEANKAGGREVATLHPQDAAGLGVTEGDLIRLFNARGACLATARLSDTLRPGVAVLPTGAWWTPEGEGGLDLAGNPNVLTRDVPASAFSGGCAAYTCLVSIERVETGAEDAMARYDAELAGLVAAG
ncbi:molybdopterin-dependent oxidoreductase [Albimonas sp. CAU 1670]|uniref:molybdopterin-dependent oxidoreductase n=1 Tax=Albimonas sp. CAU 1670 TaxID=3032599 RepID=UPI0023DC9522|nr:molybdopterin-dependent oxidoreductase [Albimonas sp. CAU 1670]MDF2234179.1 molybdopterin-dependent oxidoreductase [Albimonas sp. CAU 1670]